MLDAHDLRLALAWIAAAIIAATAFIGGCSLARARWKPQYVNADPTIIEWYSSQHNKLGNFCCDKADGHDFYGNYLVDADGSVEFDLNGKHHHLSADMVLDGPNPTGHAVYWFSGDTDYCFALGPQG
jgi:hypothetical protein